ncbi:MAG: GTP-binding protein EngB [Candidatus Thorarchaeota archaeon]|jgi:GTP-binding protein EngB required for normal cell division
MPKRVHSGTIKTNGPLIVFAGRSNVGKSSIIRALTGEKVRVGKKPGSTRREQWIDLGSVTIVDIPGFGYMAGKSKADIEKTKTGVIHKLEEWSEKIAVAVLIIDISLFRELVERWEKRNEIPIDVEFYSFLNEIAPRVLVVANKVDKMNKSQVQNEIEYLSLKLKENLPDREPYIIAISASKRKGISILKETISNAISDSIIW